MPVQCKRRLVASRKAPVSAVSALSIHSYQHLLSHHGQAKCQCRHAAGAADGSGRKPRRWPGDTRPSPLTRSRGVTRNRGGQLWTTCEKSWHRTGNPDIKSRFKVLFWTVLCALRISSRYQYQPALPSHRHQSAVPQCSLSQVKETDW